MNLPSRQQLRSTLRSEIEMRLRGMDFDGEPVAIRDNSGRVVIHRPPKRRFKKIVRDRFKREWKAVVKERERVLQEQTSAAVRIA